MIIEEKIDYVEVSIFDGHVETTGLLTHFHTVSDRLRLLTDTLQTNEMFDLKFFTITQILIGKSSTDFDTEEQYIFKQALDDQAMAKKVIIDQLKTLELEGRTTVSGFLTKDTFRNLPEKYKKEPEEISATSIVNAQRAKSLGGATSSGTTTTGNITVYNNQYNNYAKRNVKCISFIPRVSKLPSTADLQAMNAKVKEVSAGTFKQEFPDIQEDGPSQDDYEETFQDVYGDLGHDRYTEYP